MPTNCRTPEPAFRQTGKNDHWAYHVTNKNSPARAGRTKNEHMKNVRKPGLVNGCFFKGIYGVFVALFFSIDSGPRT
jgi:hypothetical protein